MVAPAPGWRLPPFDLLANFSNGGRSDDRASTGCDAHAASACKSSQACFSVSERRWSSCFRTGTAMRSAAFGKLAVLVRQEMRRKLSARFIQLPFECTASIQAFLIRREPTRPAGRPRRRARINVSRPNALETRSALRQGDALEHHDGAAGFFAPCAATVRKHDKALRRLRRRLGFHLVCRRARLSEQDDPHHRAVHAGRFQRRGGAGNRDRAAGSPQSDRHRREQARRRRHHRLFLCGEVAARRPSSC